MRWILTAAAAALTVGTLACGGGGDAAGGAVQGSVEVDGSSTVYPISEAVAEEFMAANEGNVRVTVGISGTGGGFKRFCAGETDVSNASRPIKDSERAACQEAGVDFVEVPVAYDGISLIANPDNTWVDCLTVEELRKIWEPGSTVQRWSDVRSGFPDTEIRLYGPGTDSGTFDYFTEVMMGESGASRADYTASEDDNVLVTGVKGDAGALGYLGYAYYEENQGTLKLLGVDGGQGCVQPTPETIEGGSYTPLSRPMFVYVSRQALQRPAVQEFVRFYLANAQELAREVGYIALEPEQYEQNLQQLGLTAGADAGPQ